jgi:hypothetical protein
MRIIDADALLEKFNFIYPHIEVKRIIDEQPTVYDVNNVIEQIKKSPSDRDGLRIFDGDEPMIHKSIAMEIIRRGGISETD